MLVGIDARQCELDQKLGFRPRDQYVAGNFQLEAVELAPADEICNRLPVAAPPGQRVECLGVMRAHRRFGVSGEPRATAMQDMSQQNLRLERNEATRGKRARDGRR